MIEREPVWKNLADTLVRKEYCRLSRVDFDMLLKESLKLKPELVNIRRQIHSCPELGFREVKTARLISMTLRKLGLRVREKVARTGVVGFLAGKQKGKTVAVRTDMDALPIQEQNLKAYRSKIPGIMHACGHDGKVAVVLGVALLLSRIVSELKGQVKFIFQPNEEGSGGAQAMISAGVLKNPKVDCIFSFDLSPTLELGGVGVRYGIATANVDDFEVSVIGKGGHPARFYQAVDTLMASAKIIEALHFVIPRQKRPGKPAVISIGEIHGGTAVNIIPDCVKLKGTVRTLDAETRKSIMIKIKKAVAGICYTYKAQHQIRFIPSYPSTKNDTRLTDIVTKVAGRLLGAKSIYRYEDPVFAGEDVGFFFQRIPGAIFTIGARNRKKGIIHPRHSPLFDLDEDALPIGVAVVAGCILEYLRS